MNQTFAAYAIGALGGWLVFACIVAVPIGKSMARADRTQVAVYPPPVPPVKPREDDSTWLDGVPQYIDEEAAMNREFVSIISAEWEWSE